MKFIFPDIRERSFLTVPYRATALTKALVKVINDDEIARGSVGGKRWESGGRGGRDTTANAITGALLIAIVV